MRLPEMLIKMSDIESAKKLFGTGVARWYIFVPKIQILEYGGPWNGKCWYMPFGIFYANLVYVFNGHLLVVIWYSFCLFGIFNGHLVYLTAIWYSS
jgi:hypothetical protein